MTFVFPLYVAKPASIAACHASWGSSPTAGANMTPQRDFRISSRDVLDVCHESAKARGKAVALQGPARRVSPAPHRHAMVCEATVVGSRLDPCEHMLALRHVTDSPIGQGRACSEKRSVTARGEREGKSW